MKEKRNYLLIGGSLLLALAAGCGLSAPTGQAPTSGPTTAPATAVSTTAPTMPPATAVPTSAPTVLPATAAPTPTTAPDRPAKILPLDSVWVRTGAVVLADSAPPLDFIQQGHPRPAYMAQAAPDGSYMAYVGEDGKLVVIDMSSGDNVLRPDERFEELAGFSFSPDGQSLAMTLIDGDRWRLVVRDLPDGALRVLKEGVTLGQQGGELPLLPSPVGWTSAGLVVQHLLWASDAPPQNLALIDPTDGSTQTLRKEQHIAAYPAPNGQQIAIVTGLLRIGEPPTSGIAILEAGSGNMTEILPDQQGLTRAIRWSPDGTKLLFARSNDYEAPITSIHALNADGTNEQVVEVGAPGVVATYSDIAWRDDTTPLLLSAEAGQRLQLYALPLNSFDITGLRPLGTFDRRSADRAPDQIVYVPR
jgi:hypothetical protein